jgi:hypothetical protein
VSAGPHRYWLHVRSDPRIEPRATPEYGLGLVALARWGSRGAAELRAPSTVGHGARGDRVSLAIPLRSASVFRLT